MRTRASATLTTLEGIAKYLAGVSGRKNLLWVSGGFPLIFRSDMNDNMQWLGADSRYSARISNRSAYVPGLHHAVTTETFEKECRNAIRELSAANVAVYPVDARGLTTNPAAFHNISTMQDLAAGTGGLAYFSRNDLMNSIAEAVQDSAASYTVAYHPSEQNLDGRFRKVRVMVDRPGVSLRYRSGYYDDATPTADEKAKEAAMREAVWSPLDATAVGLDAQFGPNGALRLRIDARSLVLEQRDGRWAGQLDVALAQTDEKGDECQIRLQTLPVDLAPDAYEVVMKQALILNKTVERSKAATALRVVVRDAASGSLGRVIIPLQEH
jgi:hypothetical protein